MAYQALYRKYRPSNFDEVVGQQPIIQTLKNAIVQNRIAHAYLFCGPRGTGKTSIAKIFAKMLNCEDESNKPCGKCTNCKMVQNGCKNFSNVTVIPSGKIFGSSMIFPEYFNREEKTDVTIDVSLDREIFTDYIAPTLNVKKRFVGEEKTDIITASYNRELKNNLPLYGIEVIEIPRFTDRNGQSISAKTVRNALENNDWNTIAQLVPPTTIEVLQNYSNGIRKDKIKKRNFNSKNNLF